MAEVVARQNAWKRSAATESEIYAAIGETVQIQTDLKEPPFAVTALGPSECVDDATVRVPVRITAIIPQWSLSSIGGYFLASVQTEPDEDGERVTWSNLETSPPPSSPEFEEVVLVKGGSHETHLYFRADSGSGESTVPGRPFVELHYFDGSEEIIASDLTRNAPIPERTTLEDGSLGTLWDDPRADGVGKRLSRGQWGDIPTPPKAATGETVRATTFTKLARSRQGQALVRRKGPGNARVLRRPYLTASPSHHRPPGRAFAPFPGIPAILQPRHERPDTPPVGLRAAVQRRCEPARFASGRHAGSRADCRRVRLLSRPGRRHRAVFGGPHYPLARRLPVRAAHHTGGVALRRTPGLT